MSANKTGRPNAGAQGPALNYDDVRGSIAYLVEAIARNGTLADFNRTFTYDGSSRLSVVTYTELLSSATGDIPARTNAQRRHYRKTYTYDGSSRLLKILYEFSTNNGSSFSNLSAVGGNAAENFSYDASSRLDTVTWSTS